MCSSETGLWGIRCSSIRTCSWCPERWICQQRQRHSALLDFLPRASAVAHAFCRIVSRPVENALGEDVPAEKAMIARRSRQGLRIAGQNLIADSCQALAKDFADIGMTPGTPNDAAHTVTIDIADGQLIEVRSEAAARFHLASRRHDQRLARTFAIIFHKPLAVPSSGEVFGTLHRRQVVPVQQDR